MPCKTCAASDTRSCWRRSISTLLHPRVCFHREDKMVKYAMTRPELKQRHLGVRKHPIGPEPFWRYPEERHEQTGETRKNRILTDHRSYVCVSSAGRSA